MRSAASDPSASLPLSSPLKRKRDPTSYKTTAGQSFQTPQKRTRTFQTVHPVAVEPYDSPHSVEATPTIHRTAIGPTPQKDGRVLGLFDLLSPASTSWNPSKRATLELHASNDNIITPSKKLSGTPKSNTDAKRSQKVNLPFSNAEQCSLNATNTPTVRRFLTADFACTPSSGRKSSPKHFDDTPAFLRRDSQRAFFAKAIAEGDEGNDDSGISWSPVAVRMRPKLPGKRLSQLVKGLREMEDARLDEEMEMLREMKGDVERGNTAPAPRLLVGDSQGIDTALGADPDAAGEREERSVEDSKSDQDGQVGTAKKPRVWKKKGQKRQTRRVLMRPNIAKWKPEAAWKTASDDEDADELPVVAETQLEGGGNVGESVLDTDELEHEGREPPTGKKPRGKGKEKELPKKQGKKVSATAHANFRALKIKNKNSKGKRGGRFGRRR